MSNPTALRCAVYTRKSSEEGLDQAFNSLDAQREAGQDYIRSQRLQGWTAVKEAYDDGGYSGGSTNRPGLQRLLEHIRAGRVDVVVVYKVDRLSRSLADFARLMQLFDEHKVSFVSVTQQFNTTTSMGRLTLNMLLSFAQFEREVTGERIRDKILATKRTGVWVCGQPPLGYRMPGADEDPATRRLRIVEPDATVVREAFAAYTELRSLLGVAHRLKKAGRATRRWLSTRGRWHGGIPLTAGNVYRILTNPVYIGMVTHTRAGVTQVFPGLQDPIIDRATWDRVQSLMKTAERATSTSWTHTHLLKGKVRTFEGYMMSPASAVKTRTRADGTKAVRRTPYYVSQKACRQGYKTCRIKNIGRRQLDDLVRALVLEHLESACGTDLRRLEPVGRDHWIREVIGLVTLAPDRVTVRLDPARIQACSAANARTNGKPPAALRSGSENPGGAAIPKCAYTPEVTTDDSGVTLVLHIQLRRHDSRRVLVAPDGRDLYLSIRPGGEPVVRQHLARALGQAFGWHRVLMRTGATVESVAMREGITAARVRYILHLARLGPAVVRAVLTGQLGTSMSLKDLHEAADQLDWSLQATRLRLAAADASPSSRRAIPT